MYSAAYSQIDVEEEASWPPAVLEILVDELPILRDFEAERARIDKAAQNDVYLRCHPPENQHAASRSDLIERINCEIAGHSILAWHCTRLLPHEIGWVRKQGLRVHSNILFEERIQSAIQNGHFSLEYGEELLANSRVGEFGREELLFFIMSRHILTDEHAVHSLLGRWGGEAIYANVESCDPILSIGEAAIIEVALPIEWINSSYPSFGELMMNHFLNERNIATENDANVDIILRQDFPPNKLLRVIGPNDVDFEILTKKSKWQCDI